MSDDEFGRELAESLGYARCLFCSEQITYDPVAKLTFNFGTLDWHECKQKDETT